MVKDFKIIVGKNKKEVIDLLGDQLNVPFAKEWRYLIDKNFLYRTYIIIYFDESDCVASYRVKKTFF